jgi:predicted nucleic acid-binding protein
MVVFVDTSALYALLDADDKNHDRARQLWQEWLAQPHHFVCSNYILLESVALIQRRLGRLALRRFQADMAPIFQIRWIDANLHQAAMSALLTTNQRQLSLVDCTSFELMRQLSINTVFAFDRHFAEYGFNCLP